MASKQFLSALNRELPVLFVYIGWAQRYDGTEPIVGTHGHLKSKPDNTGESSAFTHDMNGSYTCGIGAGDLDAPLHIVFIARNPITHKKLIVGIYAAASINLRETKNGVWAHATTKRALLLEVPRKYVLKEWPEGMGMRRWATRGVTQGKCWPDLRKVFNQLKRRVSSTSEIVSPVDAKTELDEELSGLEGMPRLRLIAHRKRESKLRNAKIAAVLKANNGRVACEVPGCGFDFTKRFGELGRGFAHVHHTEPLANASSKGRIVSLADLAVVCPNCHAMIHRFGACRPMNTLLE